MTSGTVVSYRNSTSNHNYLAPRLYLYALYLIEILHQTTTVDANEPALHVLYLIEILHQTTTGSLKMSTSSLLYLIEILHQTTTTSRTKFLILCCILSKFYIKPQPSRFSRVDWCVVSYRNSTSNHNFDFGNLSARMVVSYRNSTSNHNHTATDKPLNKVVSYRNSTSNHNFSCGIKSGCCVVSYRNSTSNHNICL